MATAIAKSHSRLIRVAPEDIRFTQDTVPAYFDSPHAEDRLDEAVELIASKRLSADDFPRMRVLSVKDRLWSLNNRTLWVFRQARVAQVWVKLQGQFDDDENPFLGSYMYKLMSPQEFMPQVRGECRLDFDHPVEWTNVQTDLDMGDERPSEVPLKLPPRSSLSDSSSGEEEYDDDLEKRSMTEGTDHELVPNHRPTPDFVERSNYGTQSADHTIASADCVKMMPVKKDGRAGSGRCSPMNLKWHEQSNDAHSFEGKNLEVYTDPKVEGGGEELPDSGIQDIANSNLQLLASIEGLFGPPNE